MNNGEEDITFRSKHPCYYINMERSPDRKAFVERHFENIKRIVAYDGKMLEEYTDVFPPKDISKTRDKPTSSQLACCYSHIKMIKHVYDNGDEEALFFEDDMWPKHISKWMFTIDKIIDLKSNHTECIQFFCNNNSEIEKLYRTNYLFSKWIPDHWSTGCYYMNREGMQKILDRYIKGKNIVLPDNLPNYTADDTIVYRYVNSVTCNIPTFQSRIFKSTIHTSDGEHNNSSLYETKVNKIIDDYYST